VWVWNEHAAPIDKKKHKKGMQHLKISGGKGKEQEPHLERKKVGWDARSC
jgi:hypothetical protein